MISEGRRVLVTGSSRGIGRAIATRLAEAGWDVAVHYRDDEGAAHETSSALGARASGIYQAKLDDPKEASVLFQKIAADGPVHAVVNNAGIYRPIGFASATEEDLAENLAETFRCNFESPFWLCKAAVNHFLETGSGKILNVASRVGFRGEPGAAVYAASKAALINLTRSLAVELAPNKIGVFGIAPGWVETAMVREGMQARLPEILATLPLGRMASPEDCAVTAEFLLRDEANYLSGVTIDINGASYFH